MPHPCANIIGRQGQGPLLYHTGGAFCGRLLIRPGCSADGSALEWGSRGRWFKSSHSDQENRGRRKTPPVFLGPKERLVHQRPLAFQYAAQRPQGARSAPRPLVQIQSLGPRQKKPVPFRFPGFRKGRESSPSTGSFFLSKSDPLRWAPILCDGSITDMREHVRFLFGPRSAPLCGAKIRFAQILGRGSPSPPKPTPCGTDLDA